MEEVGLPYKTDLSFRWSDIDANFHVRHSVYYDLCAHQRMASFAELGLTQAMMQEMQVGPVLFREECHFMQEIRMGDKVHLELLVKAFGRKHHKFRYAHTFLDTAGTELATLVVDGAWIDSKLRKVVRPPEAYVAAMEAQPKAKDFAWF